MTGIYGCLCALAGYLVAGLINSGVIVDLWGGVATIGLGLVCLIIGTIVGDL